ncbi:MAG TPA: penicillin-binding protein 2 [Candidatus Saccharimonadales bacterium]|nr:penicillin-binding protein 2 [Candidatus Saccharimonadales bacterium]
MKLELQKGSRSKALAVILFSLMAIFVVRLFYLQIIEHGYYVNLANQEQVKRLTIPAKRGAIYALSGQTPVPLVMNQDIYTVFADPTETTNDNAIIKTIEKVAGNNAEPNLKSLLDKKDTRYQVLATQITLQQANTIKNKSYNGIGFQAGTERVYPEGSLAAQILGFVDSSGIGQYGVEGAMNSQLAGKNGLLQSVTDVNDIPLTIGNDNINKPAVNGVNEVLTIDPSVQAYTEQALANGLKRTGATRGSVIVMDPQTGRVLAMANLPSYNPAKYNDVQNIAAFDNGVISTPYEPGSDMKTLTMATGVDKGVVNANSTYDNTDHIQVDDITISNATLGQTGIITLQHAMNWSLNTGFVTVAERLGDGSNINLQARDTMYDYYHNRFHLGELTGIQLQGEAAGTIIPPTSVQGNAVRYSNMAFGQGLDVTMLQVASAFCSIVNGGNYYKPTILAGTVDQNGNYIPNKIQQPSHPIKPSTADQVREMTQVARNTVYPGLDKPGYYVGGKTGTSQVIVNGAYSNNETIGTYLGYGGTESTSRYVIMVQVSGDHEIMAGNLDAMPIFTDISNWLLGYLNVQPKG